jgi:hypothetical protein
MGQKMFNSFYSFVTKSNVPLHKLVSINTAGQRSFQANAIIVLCGHHHDFPDFLSYRCIIHQQVLAIKRFNAKTDMDIAFKIVNSIPGKSISIRFFDLTLKDGLSDIILHTDVRWLSRCKFFKRYHSLLSEINISEREGK